MQTSINNYAKRLYYDAKDTGNGWSIISSDTIRTDVPSCLSVQEIHRLLSLSTNIVYNKKTGTGTLLIFLTSHKTFPPSPPECSAARH